MRVDLLPTGRTELTGLPRALGRLFPGHEFFAIPKVPPAIPFDGFTTSRLPVPMGGASCIQKLVQAMAAQLVPGRRGKPPDLVIVLDDLELANADQPDVVVDELRRTTSAHLASLDAPLRRRVEAALLARASFHLVVPMIESWFFADPSGPTNVGAPPAHLPPHLKAGVDFERFETDDPRYLGDDGATCSGWVSLSRQGRTNRSRRRSHRPPWLRECRERHPKAYLSWLCRDWTEKNCTTYRETSTDQARASGAAALAALDWSAALSVPNGGAFLRALVEDLADGLGARPPGPGNGQAAQLTSRFHLPRNSVLRNI